MATQIKIVNPAVPNLPLGTDQYERRYQDQFANVLRLYFNQLRNALGELFGTNGGRYVQFPSGGFQDNTTQTAAAANVAYPITFNTTDFSYGVSIGTPTSRIVVDNAGLYNFQFSTQLDKTSGASAYAWFWPRVDGVNIPDSAGKVAIQGTTAESVPAWNYVLPMKAGSYFELVWLTDDDKVVLRHEAGFGVAPNNVPEIPSVILTVTFVSALPT
jgi:hypothetical protein